MDHRARSLLWITTLLTFTTALSVNTWAQGNFVYTNDDQYMNTVSAFSVASNGSLIPVAGSPFATGGAGVASGLSASNRIGVAIVGNLLFAANTGSNNVSVFTINPNTGALKVVPGSPFATGGSSGGPGLGGIAVAPTPDGRFLMAANSGSRDITVFSIASNGALSAIMGSPFAAKSQPDGIKVSPDGKFLAAAEHIIVNNYGSDSQVEMFTIGSDGVLASLGAFAGEGGGLVAGVDIDCSGRLLYAGEAYIGNTVVDAYNVLSNGTLAPIPGSPFMPNVGSNSNVVLLSPDDKTLFVSNQISNTITAFTVASDGSLSLLSGSPFPMKGVISVPAGMATSQDGTLLYVADRNDFVNPLATVSVFSIANGGTLTEVPGSPFFTGRPDGLASLTAYPAKTCVLPLQIQIKPPTPSPVPINPKAKGKIPVAILSTLTFNAVTEVNTSTLTFGHTGNEPSLAFCGAGGEDVNGDGLVDLVCQFNTPETGLVAGDTTAFLKGQTVAGRKIQGSEGIRTVPK